MDQPTEPTVGLSLTVKGGADALDFYVNALGAVELYRMPIPDGSIAHAEFMIGNSRICISDESPEWHATAMPEGTMASCVFSIDTEDCDAAYTKATEAGAKSLNPPADQFWGARTALICDPFGYRWSLSKKTEDVSPDEMMKRAQDLMGG